LVALGLFDCEEHEMNDYKILLDVPTSNPALDFDHYASALAEIIKTSEARFAIGIFGSWGSGKTTLMQAIESKLDSSKTITVWFSAWRYEKEQHLIVPLLDTLREALVEWARKDGAVRQGAIKTAATVGKVIHSLLAGISMKVGLPQAVELSFDANKALAKAAEIDKEDREAEVPRSFYHVSFRALENAFNEFVASDPDRRIVIFVDDLDRCLPEGALEVLESMKLFFDLPGFVFVVGLDRSVIEAAIDLRYAKENRAGNDQQKEEIRIRGTEYIKKIFQVPFTLFPVLATEIDNFLSSICSEAKLSPGQEQELRDVIRPHLDFLVGDGRINPREIKRYINSYILLRKMKPSLEPHIMLALQTKEFRRDWTQVQEGLFAYRELFIDALRRYVLQNEPHALEDLDPELAAIPPAFLEYISQGKPAHPLVLIGSDISGSIDEYIYAGEAISRQGSTRISDHIRTLAELRSSLHRVVDNKFDTSSVQEVQQRIADLRSKLQSPSTSPDPYVRAAIRKLDELERTLALSKESAQEREQWFQSSTTLVNQMRRDLLEGSR
jgi:hypothetical protein